MSFEATILADSICHGIRATSMKLRYPRFIHSEFMTHRDLNRNASSSRAIPVTRLIADMRRDPAMPIHWGANQKGMQAAEELSSEDKLKAKTIWIAGMEAAIYTAQRLMETGLHKQIANRVLEPWSHINVVVTATKWNNFFGLRRHKDAQPEFKWLADLMHAKMEQSIPHELQPGEWHLPFITAAEREQHDIEQCKIVSTARCARTSYLTFDGEPSAWEADMDLFTKLVGGKPLHASPAEHQLTPDEQHDSDGVVGSWEWASPELHGNTTGWIQHRKLLPGEYIW